MTREEKLREEQEELFFKMMFHELDKADAEKYEKLNEELKKDPAYDEPEETRQKMHKFIEQEIRKRDRKKSFRTVKRTAALVAIVAALIMLMGAAAYAAIPSFQAATLNLLIEVSKEATRVAITDDIKRQDRTEILEGTEIMLLGYKFPGVPEGFALQGEWSGENRAWVRYTDAYNKTIKFQVNYSSERDVALDTEDAETEKIEIHGCEGIKSVEDDYTKIFWHDELTKITIYVEAKGLNSDFIYEIAKKVEAVD